MKFKPGALLRSNATGDLARVTAIEEPVYVLSWVIDDYVTRFPIVDADNDFTEVPVNDSDDVISQRMAGLASGDRAEVRKFRRFLKLWPKYQAEMLKRPYWREYLGLEPLRPAVVDDHVEPAESV